MATSLTEFLLARIAEDEAVAQATRPGPWDELEFHDLGRGDDAHVARHSPARVLAESAAKRQVVQHLRAATRDVDRAMSILDTKRGGPGEDAAFARWSELDSVHRETRCIAGHVAKIYTDHPDYDPEWDL